VPATRICQESWALSGERGDVQVIARFVTAMADSARQHMPALRPHPLCAEKADAKRAKEARAR